MQTAPTQQKTQGILQTSIKGRNSPKPVSLNLTVPWRGYPGSERLLTISVWDSLWKNSSTSNLKEQLKLWSINWAHFENKLILIWLYLILKRGYFFLERKRSFQWISNSDSVNWGLHILFKAHLPDNSFVVAGCSWRRRVSQPTSLILSSRTAWEPTVVMTQLEN